MRGREVRREKFIYEDVIRRPEKGGAAGWGKGGGRHTKAVWVVAAVCVVVVLAAFFMLRELIVVDETAPVIILNGDDCMYVKDDIANFEDPGATAIDDVDGDLTEDIVSSLRQSGGMILGTWITASSIRPTTRAPPPGRCASGPRRLSTLSSPVGIRSP